MKKNLFLNEKALKIFIYIDFILIFFFFYFFITKMIHYYIYCITLIK